MKKIKEGLAAEDDLQGSLPLDVNEIADLKNQKLLKNQQKGENGNQGGKKNKKGGKK